jgi:acetyl-CoA carboxylase biotin carboxylase subunit
MPSPGKIDMYLAPGGNGVRVDSAMYPGYSIPPFYDSMVAKLITFGDTREEAIAKMKRALGEFVIDGVDTTILFHEKLMNHEVFISGDFDTKFLEKYDLFN